MRAGRSAIAGPGPSWRLRARRPERRVRTHRQREVEGPRGGRSRGEVRRPEGPGWSGRRTQPGEGWAGRWPPLTPPDSWDRSGLTGARDRGVQRQRGAPAGCGETQHEGHIPNRGLTSKRAVALDPGPPLPEGVSPALCGGGAGSRAGTEPWGWVLFCAAAEGQGGAVVRNPCREASYWMPQLWGNYLSLIHI